MRKAKNIFRNFRSMTLSQLKKICKHWLAAFLPRLKQILVHKILPLLWCLVSSMLFWQKFSNWKYSFVLSYWKSLARKKEEQNAQTFGLVSSQTKAFPPLTIYHKVSWLCSLFLLNYSKAFSMVSQEMFFILQVFYVKIQFTLTACKLFENL